MKEEVVLSQMGSRLFLGFSEVNPETCANALFSVIKSKSDEELQDLEESRRNLAWALDHLAFDRRSFKNAMLTYSQLFPRKKRLKYGFSPCKYASFWF